MKTIIPLLLILAMPTIAMAQQPQQTDTAGDRLIAKYQLARDYLHACDRMIRVSIDATVPVDQCAAVIQTLAQKCPSGLLKVDCKTGEKTKAWLNTTGTFTFLFGADL